MSIQSVAATDAVDLRRRTSPILLSSDGRIAGSSLGISARCMRDLRARPLAGLGLSQRAVNGARDAGLLTISDIVDLSERELCTVRGFGPASLRALCSALLWIAVGPDSLGSETSAAEQRVPHRGDSSLPESLPTGLF